MYRRPSCRVYGNIRHLGLQSLQLLRLGELLRLLFGLEGVVEVGECGGGGEGGVGNAMAGELHGAFENLGVDESVGVFVSQET